MIGRTASAGSRGSPQAQRHVLRDRRRGRDPAARRRRRLHSRRHDREVQLLGFDLLELDGTDLRRDPLMNRKATLASLLRRSRDGIQYVEHIEATDGRTVFDHACKLGLEGIVSKRRDKPYEHGRSRMWLKVKNPASETVRRDQGGGVALAVGTSGAAGSRAPSIPLAPTGRAVLGDAL